MVMDVIPIMMAMAMIEVMLVVMMSMMLHY